MGHHNGTMAFRISRRTRLDLSDDPSEITGTGFSQLDVSKPG
jgi:hypothetical protein